MDPNEAQNIAQYMQLFGHAPPGISPENLKLVQALQTAKAAVPAQSVAAASPPTFNRATPGVGGAISDAVKAAAGAMAPKAVTQQSQREAALEAANQ
jgi:hypothetical protein